MLVRVFFDETMRVVSVEQRLREDYTEKNVPMSLRQWSFLVTDHMRFMEQNWNASPREFVVKEETVVYDPTPAQVELRDAREMLRYPGGLDREKWQDAVWRLNTIGQPVP